MQSEGRVSLPAPVPLKLKSRHSLDAWANTGTAVVSMKMAISDRPGNIEKDDSYVHSFERLAQTRCHQALKCEPVPPPQTGDKHTLSYASYLT